ncbi:thioredoxin family protein [Aerophototrophica crusticola]|uniref:Thioredoxin family protein n=1 Tax=Aerophototrophica crusticola TaxID=1709002 RepID=A0A858R3V0_9PROT|nr:thioredoxin family protein [Rhodospirillaceae bacterium B3]
MRRTRFAFLAATALLLSAPTLPAMAAGEGLPAYSQAFDPARDPAADLNAALADAKATGRHVLIDVGGDWCIWCKLLDGLFEQNAELRTLRDKNFVLLKVHYDKKVNQNKAFLSQYPKVAGYPHLFVLDADGKLLHSQDTGQLELPKEQGKGHDVTKVKAFLEAWAPKGRGV